MGKNVSTFSYISYVQDNPRATLMKGIFRALKLREYGLKYRDEYRLYPKRPTCTSNTNYITIGFTECYFALVSMGYGMMLSIIMLVLELLWHKR